MKCSVYENCLKNWNCDWCDNYNEYTPKIKKILSPRQEEERARRKNERHKRRNSDPSKRGKANRKAGKRAEKSLEALFKSWSIPCSRVPMSGALKGTQLVGVPDDIFSGDLRIIINDKPRRIESKSRSNFDKFYKMTEGGVIRYEDSYFLMPEKDFSILLSCGKLGEYQIIHKEPTKALHSFFNQDNSDIVALKMNYLPWIFAVKEEFITEMMK
jgi:hypothetical protein